MAIDPEIIKRYSDEMLEMQKRANPSSQSPVPENTAPDTYGEGGLIVRVTTLKGLYPVEGAAVTVYTDDGTERTEYASMTTDESGKTETIQLAAPNKLLSESAGASAQPYSRYNISVLANGYIENIHMNVPVFDGVVSVQTADLLSVAAAGDNLEPRVFDESRRYEL